MEKLGAADGRERHTAYGRLLAGIENDVRRRNFVYGVRRKGAGRGRQWREADGSEGRCHVMYDKTEPPQLSAIPNQDPVSVDHRRRHLPRPNVQNLGLLASNGNKTGRRQVFRKIMMNDENQMGVPPSSRVQPGATMGSRHSRQGLRYPVAQLVAPLTLECYCRILSQKMKKKTGTKRL